MGMNHTWHQFLHLGVARAYTAAYTPYFFEVLFVSLESLNRTDLPPSKNIR
jgi:hypothetical protein